MFSLSRPDKVAALKDPCLLQVFHAGLQMNASGFTFCAQMKQWRSFKQQVQIDLAAALTWPSAETRKSARPAQSLPSVIRTAPRAVRRMRRLCSHQSGLRSGSVTRANESPMKSGRFTRPKSFYCADPLHKSF